MVEIHAGCSSSSSDGPGSADAGKDNTSYLPPPPDGESSGDAAQPRKRFDVANIFPDTSSGSQSPSIDVYLSNGQKFDPLQRWLTNNGGWGDTDPWLAGDFDGDGHTDLLAVWTTGDPTSGSAPANFAVRRADGSKFTGSDWGDNVGNFSTKEKWVVGTFH